MKMTMLYCDICKKETDKLNQMKIEYYSNENKYMGGENRELCANCTKTIEEFIKK